MIEAVIFDLDGVLVSTDEFHYRGWRRLADEVGTYFDREMNERCRGVSRMESLEVVLERADREFSDAEKQEFADRKNRYYREMLDQLTPEDTLPGARQMLLGLRERGVKTAIASSSRNAGDIAERIEIRDLVDTLVDGNDITRSKPDPQVFQLAADQLGVAPGNCLVVEDAQSGIEAARRAGMHAFGIGTPEGLPNAPRHAESLAELTPQGLLEVER